MTDRFSDSGDSQAGTDLAVRSRRRKWGLAGAALVLALGVSVPLIIFLAPNTDSASTPSPTSSEEPKKVASTEPLAIAKPASAPLSDDEVAEAERAQNSVVAVVEANNEILTRGDGSSVGAEEIATGFVLGEIQSRAQEQMDWEYTQVGEAKVTSVTASNVDLDADPPVMTLTVCIDVSDVDMLDAAGQSMKAALYNPGRPVKHIYGAEFRDGVWKIATHDIPDQQDCQES